MKTLKILFAIGIVLGNIAVQAEQATDITVYRSPSCSCCGNCLAHLKQHHFSIKDIATDDMQAIKDKYGVSDEMASCHTAVVNGYVVEGHVPAEDIKVLLKTKPSIVGIAVPQMPNGTPGMEMGDKKDPYNVMSFDSDQHYQVFKNHSKQ
jgi:hypothetical protein